MVYLNLKEEYLENRMHPNHLELLKAGKIYFKDDTYMISKDRVKYSDTYLKKYKTYQHIYKLLNGFVVYQGKRNFLSTILIISGGEPPRILSLPWEV